MQTISSQLRRKPLLSGALLASFFLLGCERPGRQNQQPTGPIASQEAPAAAPGPKKQLSLPTLDCSYDNEVSTLGQGLVVAPEKFTVFNDSLLTDTLASQDMYQLDGSQTRLCSKYYKPDYGIMDFVCLGSTAKAYRILLNHSIVKFMPKQPDYHFLTWNDYILNSNGIRRSEEEGHASAAVKLPLRTRPHGSADTLAIPDGHEMFCPLEVKGDWVRVRFDCFYNKESNIHEGKPCAEYIGQCKTAATGWLRWRQGNKVLIDILLLC